MTDALEKAEASYGISAKLSLHELEELQQVESKQRQIEELRQRVWTVSGGSVALLVGIAFILFNLRRSDRLLLASNAQSQLLNNRQDILNTIPDLMFEVGPDGRYYDCHSPHPDLLAAPVADLLGKTVSDVLPPAAAETCLSALREAHEKGTSTGKQFELPLAHGKFWFELFVSRKHQRPGDEPRFIILSRDITERKRTEEALYFVAQRGWMQGTEYFFDALAQYLGDTLGVDYVFIDRLGKEPGTAETVALFAKGSIVPNLRYDLKGTPCENVMGRKFCFYPQGIQQLFPEDSLLTEMGAESYAGLPLWDSAGKPIGLIAVMHGKPLSNEGNIARLLQLMAIRAAAELERERNERALQEREHEFRSLAESSPDSIIRYDRDGRMRYLNPGLLGFFGLSAADIIGRLPREVWPDGRYAEIDRAVARALGTGEATVVEFCEPDTTGKVRSHQIHVVPERDVAGQIAGAIAFGREITELRNSEKQLTLLSYALDHVKESAHLSAEDARFVYVNAEMCRALEYTRDELLGSLSVPDIDPDFQLVRWSEHWRNLKANGSLTFETRHKAKDGRIFPVEINANYFEFDGKGYNLALIRDITERRRAEHEAYLLNSALDNSFDATYLLGTDLRFRYVNEAAARALGYSREELLSLNLLDIAPNVTREMVHGLMEQTAVTGRFPGVVESRHRRKNGETFPIEIGASTFSHEDETLFLTAVRDITERKCMEDELRASEQQFRTLAENMPDNIVRYNREGVTVYVNPMLERTLGDLAASMIGTTPREYHPDGSFEDYAQLLDTVLANNEAGELEKIMPGPDGKASIHQIRMIPERDGNGGIVGALAIGRDITNHKEGERRLKESQARLRSLAARRETAREEERKHLAREVHDDLGQILNVLKMNVAVFAHKYAADSEPLRDHLQETLMLTDRAVGAARNIVSALRPAAIDLGIAAALEWLAGDFASNTGILCVVHIEDEEIELEEGQAIALFRIVQESLSNVAKHAQANRVEIALDKDAADYVLKVRDNGIGFDINKKKRGSFGLVGMRERALVLSGTVSIDSRPGGGTEVLVQIPVASRPPSPD